MTDKERSQRALVVSLPDWIPPLVDLALVAAAFLLGYYVRYELQLLRPVFEANRAPFEPFVPYVLLFGLWVILVMQGQGLYRHQRGRTWTDEVVSIGNATMQGMVAVMALSFFLQPLVFSRLLLLYGGVFSGLFIALARLVYRVWRRRQRLRGVGVERVLIVGSGEVGRAVMRNMLARPDLGFQVVGFVDENPLRSTGDIGRMKALGKTENLAEIVETEHIDMVIVTLSWQHHRQILLIMRECARQSVQVRIVPDLFQMNLSRLQVENLEGIPLLGVQDQMRIQTTGRILKRVMDVGLTVLSAPFWLPVFGVIALAIWLEDKGPPFYTQERVGEDGRMFRVVKFRTMIQNADDLKAQLVEEQGLDPRHPKLKDDPRITKVGGLLRRSSLDELPQIFNVLRGEMSLVGPRPPTPDEVALYEHWHMQRLETRGGMTGLWQVSGRSDVPFEEMVLLDLYYIENWSLLLDLQIMLRTIPHVLFGSGAY